jgi:hypothetical protein
MQRDGEYKRFGTLTLMAAIDLQTGEAVPMVRKTHVSKDYVGFLKMLDGTYPQDSGIRWCLTISGCTPRKRPERTLKTMPGRCEFVFTRSAAPGLT